MTNNLPVSYDFHGDIPMSVPFSQLAPHDIHLYLDVDNHVGVKTCGQACKHCWFVNYPKVVNRAFGTDVGVGLFDAFGRKGYKVFPRYTDSFAYGGELMKKYGLAAARTYFEGEETAPTETMNKGEAWTSGRPLLNEDAQQLLDIARLAGYGTITMTYHGVLNDDLTLRGSDEYPIKGVLAGADFERVVRIINDYNARHRGGGFDGFRIGVGITVGTHNNTRESLSRYLRYFDNMGVCTVRFNKFFDHGYKHPHLVLSEEQVRQVYRDLNWLHRNLAFSFQLGVSEDFGTTGIKEMGFPAHVGWCRAGRQLFAVIPTAFESTVPSRAGYRYERIGDIVGCVNVFEPTVGAVYRKTNLVDGSMDYDWEFFVEEIDKLLAARLTGELKNGCFARELMDKIDAPLRKKVIAIESRP